MEKQLSAVTTRKKSFSDFLSNVFYDCEFRILSDGSLTKDLCDGTNDLSLGPICGKPLALSFNYKTSDLYITDAFFGHLVVGFNGGLATILPGVTSIFQALTLSNIDVESYTRNVYMTDTSLTYDIRIQIERRNKNQNKLHNLRFSYNGYGFNQEEDVFQSAITTLPGYQDYKLRRRAKDTCPEFTEFDQERSSDTEQISVHKMSTNFIAKG
ncbi:Six-bladed beta-propeller, TolB-like protein [Artemisia annua]|uniref:Six-bladed beta-propeller, TolB-like protein n=1 Tax=Artemisia annua TaxID=35608 RepID=A0A2U1PZ18_ARTAN|nr:Six-bladed beta-propeller, TolB-like protein [Artemisia annua]